MAAGMFHKHYWNVFSHLNETIDNPVTTRPHARTLKTNIWQKCVDAFTVFSGYTYLEKKADNGVTKIQQAKSGLFDYALLQLPSLIYIFDSLLSNLSVWASKKRETIKLLWLPMILLFLPFVAVKIVLALLMIPIFILRNLSALALTVLSLPFIVLAQIITYGVAHEDWVALKEETKLNDEWLYMYGSGQLPENMQQPTVVRNGKGEVEVCVSYHPVLKNPDATFMSKKAAQDSRLHFFNIAGVAPIIDKLKQDENVPNNAMK